MTYRWSWRVFGALSLVALVGGTARAEGDYERLTLSVNAPYLLVPLVEVNAELAVREHWSGALRVGAGNSDLSGEDHTIAEVGGQLIHYVWGSARRGMQLGLDTRFVHYEGGGMLMGMGDGVAVGPFIGYKRVFGSGVTLGGQIGAQVAAVGESDGTVLPYLAVSLGVSLWNAGEPGSTAVAASAPGDTAAGELQSADLRGPLDHHRGLMFGFSLGGGSASGSCDACELAPGIAVDASVGWFVHRRVAVMYDATATVGLFSGGTGSAGVGLQSLAVQYWPHEDLWLKVGVGAARVISTSLITGPGFENGGGGTLAAGYEFHHNGKFNMDVQLRATHGSFDQAGGEAVGADTFVGLVGFNWY